jgi:transposase InsO family protein
VSQRRACRLVGQPRATQRLTPADRSAGEGLVKRVLELARMNPRFGYRRTWALLRQEGWKVNRKRVHRLWREQGLKVPQKQRKRRRLGTAANGCVRHRAERRGQVWAWDFVHDRTADGRPLKWLSVVDEFTRECVALEVRRGMTAGVVVGILAGLVRERGAPAHVRSDNGPEFIAEAIRGWLARAGVAALYIEPGSPWENGYAESFHSRLRDELLDREEFASLLEAQVLGREWRQAYNHERPHSSLGYRTPAAFAAGCQSADSAALRRPTDTAVVTDPTLIAAGT